MTRGAAGLPQKEIGETRNHVGSIIEIHQELIQAQGVCHISLITSKSSIFILVPKENIHILCFVKGSY